MAPTHHPSAQALADFLIGDCSPGEALLIARHLDRCPHCASRVRAMGAVGGVVDGVSLGVPRLLRQGVELIPMSGASGLGEAVYQLNVAPGAALPLDEPLRVAEILLLEGGCSADGETYGPGDFLSLDETPTAPLVALEARGCVCIVTAHDPLGLSID